MKEAILIIDDKRTTVDLPTYMRFLAENAARPHKIVCPECSRQVHKFNVSGAKGFRVVNLEVGKRARGNRRPTPGFHHLDHNAGAECPLSFVNDPRYAGLREGNRFAAEVREANKDALAVPSMRRAIREVQEYLLFELTRKTGVTDEQDAGLKKVETRMMSLAGLDRHMWALGYIGPTLIGAQERMGRTQVLRVEFTPVGQHSLPFVGLDGQARALVVPQMLRICFSHKQGWAKAHPLRPYSGGPTLDYNVSREAAIGIVQQVRQEARARAEAAERERLAQLGAAAKGVQLSLDLPPGSPRSPHAGRSLRDESAPS